MVTLISSLPNKYRGMSTDVKPGAHNGDEFFEIDTGITFYFNGDGGWVNKDADFPVSLAITTAPSTTTYYEDDLNFDPTGMVVKVTDDSEETTTVDNDNLEYDSALKVGQTSIKFRYLMNGVYVETSQDITVTALALSSIAITTAPTKTAYTEGEVFDPEGMVVTATYNSGNTEEVEDYTYEPSDALETTDESVTVKYTYREVEKTATQSITVTEDEESE